MNCFCEKAKQNNKSPIDLSVYSTGDRKGVNDPIRIHSVKSTEGQFYRMNNLVSSKIKNRKVKSIG